jgi:hypothetical protein
MPFVVIYGEVSLYSARGRLVTLRQRPQGFAGGLEVGMASVSLAPRLTTRTFYFRPGSFHKRYSTTLDTQRTIVD